MHLHLIVLLEYLLVYSILLVLQPLQFLPQLVDVFLWLQGLVFGFDFLDFSLDLLDLDIVFGFHGCDSNPQNFDILLKAIDTSLFPPLFLYGLISGNAVFVFFGFQFYQQFLYLPLFERLNLTLVALSDRLLQLLLQLLDLRMAQNQLVEVLRNVAIVQHLHVPRRLNLPLTLESF